MQSICTLAWPKTQREIQTNSNELNTIENLCFPAKQAKQAKQIQTVQRKLPVMVPWSVPEARTGFHHVFLRASFLSTQKQQPKHTFSKIESVAIFILDQDSAPVSVPEILCA